MYREPYFTHNNIECIARTLYRLWRWLTVAAFLFLKSISKAMNYIAHIN